MPKHIVARPASDAEEESIVRKLATSRHGPADVIRRARMVVKSWEGKDTRAIADELACHAQTVRERVTRFRMRVDGAEKCGSRKVSAALSWGWLGRPRQGNWCGSEMVSCMWPTSKV